MRRIRFSLSLSSSIPIREVLYGSGTAPLTNGYGSGSSSIRQWYQEAKNNCFFSNFLGLLHFEGTFFILQDKSHKENRRTKKVFLTIFAWWWKDPEPDSHPDLWLTDPDPGGPKITDPEQCFLLWQYGRKTSACVSCSFQDPWHFDTNPEPHHRITNPDPALCSNFFQEANKK